MSDQVEDVIETPDELSALKARADLMGISYHPSIGLEKLREKVNGALTKDKPAPKEDVSEESERAKLIREASALIRIRVTCMNPNKKELEGEIFSVGNSVVGTFKKYVPFNADEGWHVPKIIYDQLVQRECQTFYTVRENGRDVKRSKLIKEFAIEVLPPLTEAELKDLAQRQAMSHAID